MQDALPLLEILWNRIFRSLWILAALVIVCMAAAGACVVISLNAVSANQAATITNQDRITEKTNTLIEQTTMTIERLNSEITTQYAIMVKARERNLLQYEAQQAELASYKMALSNIVASEREVITKQAQILVATREAVEAAKSAAASTRNTNRTITEKVVTTDEKKSADKQKAKLDTKTQAVDASQKKLNTLVHQYKSAIKKAGHP